MAVPTDGRQIDNLLSTTLDYFMPDLYDQVYNSNALFGKLAEMGNIVEGGAQCNAGLIYDKVPGGPYGKNEAFNTDEVETTTQFRWPWARYYANGTIDGLEAILNSGEYALVNRVETMVEQCKMRLCDDLGSDLITSLGTDSRRVVGLAAYVNDGTIGGATTYGGITYGTDTLGAANKSETETTGGAFSLSGVNVQYQEASKRPTAPNLVLTTQTLGNKWWDRAQPAQQIPSGSDFNYMAKLGFDVIKMNRADVIEDSHVPTGYIYILTTDYMELQVIKERNLVWDGWYRPGNRDQRIGQVLWAGQLVGRSPRLNAVMTGVT